MQPFGKNNRTWAFVMTLGLMTAACVVQKSPSVTNWELPPESPTETTNPSELTPATKATVQTAYGQLPLHFEANQGQSNSQVKFVSRAKATPYS